MPLKPDADYSKTKTYLIAEGKHQSITTAEILTAARSLISKPENWTQGEYARDSSGERVSEHDQDAVCFCTIGALLKAEHALNIYISAFARNHPSINYLKTFLNGSVADYNDSSTHAEVLELFDKAIAELNKPN